MNTRGTLGQWIGLYCIFAYLLAVYLPIALLVTLFTSLNSCWLELWSMQHMDRVLDRVRDNQR